MIRVHSAVLALALVCCWGLCSGQPAQPLNGGITLVGAGTYCGSRLADALKFMCNGRYNSYFKIKKTPPPVEYWAPPVQLPFRDRLRAAAFLESRPRSRFTRGVFDECCSKSCTIDELMSYCQGSD